LTRGAIRDPSGDMSGPHSATDAATSGGAGAFRSDINGLRAIAIALVMAFHLAPGVAPGGFIGVDVFFVISGYLMTRVILGRIDEGRFGLLAFYLARLRRIWPALVVLCAVLALAGAFALDPWTYQRSMRDTPAALFFVSNLLFARRVGYFAPSEHGTWLLHTWSLSVEWQFYLLYPLLLIGLFAVAPVRRRLWLILGLVTALSFALALWGWTRSSEASFYLLPTRAWELLAGALVMGAQRRWKPGGAMRAVCHALGLAAIATGAVVADASPGWPSATALLPVGGAALVIAAGVRRTFWAENPVVTAIGRASYSIYIWHWPVILALRETELPATAPFLAGEVAAMVGLGLLSYWLIEQRLTALIFRRRWTRWSSGLALVAATAAVAVIGAQTHGFEAARTAGLPATLRAALADDRAAATDWAYPRVCAGMTHVGVVSLCSLGDPAARQVVVIGDSHAEQFAPRYANAFADGDGRGVTFVTHRGCPPIPHVARPRGGPECAAWSLAAYRWIEQAGFRRVALVSSWLEATNRPRQAPLCRADAGGCLSGMFGGPTLTTDQVFDLLGDEVRRLQARGIEVVIFGPASGHGQSDPESVYRLQYRLGVADQPPTPRAELEASSRVARAELQRIARLTGAALVDPLDALCPGGLCPITDGGRTLYMTPGHFRASAVTQPRFAYLDAWLAPPASPPAPIRLK
jgi:peptidoglycan/LPS O-acetylase OafA/YrhL